MKKTLLTIALLSASLYGFSQFTAGNLVVYRYGDKTNALGVNNVATPAFLDEYTTAGVRVGTGLALSTSNTTGLALTGNPFGSNEGQITLSPNGTYLTVFGHNVSVDGTITNGATTGTPRSLGLVLADKSYTMLEVASKVENPRCAITVDGSDFFIIGSKGSVQFTNATTSLTSITSGDNAYRGLTIFNNQLYNVTNGSANLHISKVGTGIPSNTTTTTLNAIPGFTTTVPANPNQAIFFKTTAGAGEPNLMYVADDANGNLEKYAFDGTTWVAKGSITGFATGRYGIKSVTGYLDGGTVHLFGTTAYRLFKVDDASAATSLLSASNVPVDLVTVADGATEKFQSVAFTPGTVVKNTLPISLSSFTGAIENNTVKLNWTTASEKNNKNFSVLRAGEDKEFTQIGEVAGAGNSDSKKIYVFKDVNPSSGNNYYKLLQTDFNGNSEEFGPVVVSTSISANSFTVSAGENAVNMGVSALLASQAQVRVFNISGATLADESISIEKGFNTFAVPVNQLKSGVYVVTVTIDGKTVSKKFVK